MKNEQKDIQKKLKKAIKHAFNKMKTNDEMAKDFIEFLEKWGCIKYDNV